jgi:putative tricarboxylic transport membrane protein
LLEIILVCLIGVLIGNAVGILPGIGPMPIMALLLPVTYHISDPTLAIVLMTSVYYGSAYGGTLTSVISGVPGEVSTAIVNQNVVDLKKEGRASEILYISAIGSFISGIIATSLIYFLSISISLFSLNFGPIQYTILLIISLFFIVITNKNYYRSITVLCLGMLIGLIGFDSTFGENRFSFGVLTGDKIPLLAFIMGVYGLSTILLDTSDHSKNTQESYNIKLSYSHILKNWWAIIRGTTIGFISGILPGITPVTAASVSYNLENRLSKDKMKSIASVEAANNSHDQSSIIPLLLIGIPANGVSAIMLTMLVNKGITPGLNFITDHSLMFTTIVLSMLLGNIIMVLVNLKLINIWIALLKVPKNILYIIITIVCFYSVYIINNKISDLIFLISFTAIGYILKRRNYELAPMLIGFITASLLEENIGRAILLI